MATTPHLALPMRVVNGQFATVEEGSEQEVFQSAATVLRFREGHRPEAPDFGLPDQVHEQGGPTPADALTALERDEPRAVAQAAETLDDPDGYAARLIVEVAGGA